MLSSRLPEQHAFTIESDASSSVGYAQGASLQVLIEHGFHCLERELYAEGAVFFALAREQVQASLPIGPLLVALDTLQAAVADYLQAHKALLEASKRLASSDNEQQAQVAALRKLLPTLAEIAAPAPKTPALKEPRHTQPLRLLHPSKSADAEETSSNQLSAPEEKTSQNQQTTSLAVIDRLPALSITCFGRFEVRRGDAASPSVSLCHNLKGQATLRYLVAQPRHRETVELLMTKLWPEEVPEVAQRKLRVAASALRRSLNQDVTDEQGGGYILCKDQVYQINPAVVLHTDIDAFLSLYAAGQRASDSAAIDLYEQACNLYSGPFLAEDIYEEWSFMRREELAQIYVAMCDRLADLNLASGNYQAASRWASAMLAVDRCDEEAHRQLIRAYAAQKRRSEALRQYQQCQHILSEELGVEPMPETQRLFQLLLKGEDLLPTPHRQPL